MAQLGIAAWAGLLLCTLGVGCGTDLYVIGQLHEIEGETREHALTSCTPIGGRVPAATGEGGSGGRDLVIKQDIAGDSFRVIVTSGDQELARRKYGEKRLESGERDEFTVTTHAGRTYELAYWGARECVVPELSESE